MEHKISNELPPLQGQASGENITSGESLPYVGAETRANQAFEAGQGQPQVPQVAQAPQPALAPQSQPQIAVPPSVMPAIADDVDVIEKEWVNKAKEIVARTKDDPYQQNKEMEIVKADYMKKRYNKDIRVAED